MTLVNRAMRACAGLLTKVPELVKVDMFADSEVHFSFSLNQIDSIPEEDSPVDIWKKDLKPRKLTYTLDAKGRMVGMGERVLSDRRDVMWTVENGDEQSLVVKCFFGSKVHSLKIKDRIFPRPTVDAGSCESSSDGRSLALICTRSVDFREHHRQNLGEQLEEFDETCHLLLVHLSDELVFKEIDLPNQTPDMIQIPLQVTWNTDDPEEFFVTYMEIPRSQEIPGLRFCYNRPTRMARTRGSVLVPFGEGDHHHRSIRATDRYVLYLRLPLPCHPHAQCMQLMAYYPSTDKHIVLVDQVKEGMGGIEWDLAKYCIYEENGTENVLFSGTAGFETNIYSVQVVPPEAEKKCIGQGLRLLGVRNGQIYALRTSIRNVGEIVRGLDWKTVLEPPVSTSPLGDVFNGQYALVKVPKPKGVIVCAHGGPNGRFSSDYQAIGPVMSTIASHLDLDILLLNYIGSTGYGKSSPERLIGAIGQLDVENCVDLILKAKKEYETEREWKRWIYSGGSHGGFLGVQLIADSRLRESGLVFDCAILRNPVCNGVQLLFSSDIKDYVYSQYMEGRRTIPEVISRLWMSSPVRLVDEIKTPCLFLLGKSDKRVPFHNGMYCYNELRARGVECDLCLYEDNHSLSKDANIRLSNALFSIRWILKYMGF